MDHQNVVLSGL